jgi:4-hydroxy-tetrahydrodipicolinate synthase
MLRRMLSTWTGVFCALWTPTDSEGRLLKASLKANLDFLHSRGIGGLLPIGSTGEFLHLDVPARKEVLLQIADWFDPARVIVNVSDIRPAAVLELARFAKLNRFGAISLLPPYFYSVDQEDLREFFVRAAGAAELPLFLYNFPERTGNRIGLETISAVADAVPLAGVKQSGAEFEYHRDLVELGRKRNFVVLTGADTRLPEAVALGVSGCVSGLSNAVPDLVKTALHEAFQGRTLEPKPAALKMAELARRIQKVQFPLHVAALMEARGLEVGVDKTIVSAETKRRYTELVNETRALFQQWKLI